MDPSGSGSMSAQTSVDEQPSPSGHTTTPCWEGISARQRREPSRNRSRYGNAYPRPATERLLVLVQRERMTRPTIRLATSPRGEL